MQSTDSEYDSGSEEGTGSISNYPTGRGRGRVEPDEVSDELPEFDDLIEGETMGQVGGEAASVDSDQEVSSFEHDERSFVVAPFDDLDSATSAQRGEDPFDVPFDAAVGVVFEGDLVAPVESEAGERMAAKLFTERVEPGDDGHEAASVVFSEAEDGRRCLAEEDRIDSYVVAPFTTREHAQDSLDRRDRSLPIVETDGAPVVNCVCIVAPRGTEDGAFVDDNYSVEHVTEDDPAFETVDEAWREYEA